MTPLADVLNKVLTWVCLECHARNARTVPFSTRRGELVLVTCRECAWSTSVTIAEENLMRDRRMRPRVPPPL